MDLQTLAVIGTICGFILAVIGFLYKILFGEWNLLEWLRKRRSKLETAILERVTADEAVADYTASKTQIERKGSTTAGFVGQTERGTTSPTFLISWDDFNRVFGRETGPSVSFLGHAVRGFFENGGPRAYIVRVVGENSSAALVQLPIVDNRQFLKMEANSVGNWGNKLFVRIQDGTRIGFRLTISYYRSDHSVTTPNLTDLNSPMHSDASKAEVEEDYDNLGFEPDGPNYVLDIINRRSQLVNVSWENGFLAPARPDNMIAQLNGGSDGEMINTVNFIGKPGEHSTGLAALETVEDISILCVPDHVHPSLNNDDQLAIAREMVNQCERLNDRFAILSLNRGQKEVSTLRPPVDTSFAAIYYPWIRVFDTFTNSNVLIPPVGHIAGAYARSDAEQGVHKAPSNLKIRGLVPKEKKQDPLEFNFNSEQLDILKRLNINAILDLGTDNEDIRVSSAFTMSVDETWKYVNVRRFSLFVMQSIDLGTLWVEFENNDETLWGKVRNEVTKFLTKLLEDGALRGNTSEEAFFVKCDRTTMTEDDILNGRLICLFGVSMVDPPICFVLDLVRKAVPPINETATDF